jgi:hypothetical protein
MQGKYTKTNHMSIVLQPILLSTCCWLPNRRSRSGNLQGGTIPPFIGNGAARP